MTQDQFINFYNSDFLPVYADTVAYLADKPAQIIIEIENTFSHIAQYLNNNNSDEVKNANIEKAYNHLLRATIDCYKILWVTMNNDIEVFMGNSNNRKFTVNLSENDAMNLWIKFKEKAQDARRKELSGVGITPLNTITAYKETVEIGWELLKNCDREKLSSLKKFNLINTIKEQWIGFILGIIGSALVTIVAILFQ